MDMTLQDSLLKAIDIMVSDGIKKANYTSSTIGKVKAVSLPDCTVSISNNDITCIIPDHLHDWIVLDDIVIVQDLYGDNTKKAIIGKVGSARPASLVMYDTVLARNIGIANATEDSETGVTDQDMILEIE